MLGYRISERSVPHRTITRNQTWGAKCRALEWTGSILHIDVVMSFDACLLGGLAAGPPLTAL